MLREIRGGENLIERIGSLTGSQSMDLRKGEGVEIVKPSRWLVVVLVISRVAKTPRAILTQYALSKREMIELDLAINTARGCELSADCAPPSLNLKGNIGIWNRQHSQ